MCVQARVNHAKYSTALTPKLDKKVAAKKNDINKITAKI